MKNKLKKVIKLLITVIVLIPCMLIFSACDSTAEKLAKELGFSSIDEMVESLRGADGEDGKDATQIDTYDLWETAVSNGEFKGTYLDFIAQYLNIGVDATSLVASSAIRSVVSVSVYSDSNYKYSSTSASGVIFSLDGQGNAYIVTNYHVCSSSSTSSILSHYKYYKVWAYGMSDGITASYIGGSRTYDIAILYVESSEELLSSGAVAATFSQDDAVLGSEVLAIGNTTGQGLSVTKGVVSVSSENRSIPVAGEEGVYRLIRFDAYIAGGNSGGGLFDMNGNLIGITNGGVSSEVNKNFALPSSLVYKVAKNLIYYYEHDEDYAETNNYSSGQVYKADLGISEVVTQSYSYYDSATGLIEIIETVTISEVDSGSIVETNGILQVGDSLKSYKINNAEEVTITKSYTLSEILLTLTIGDTIQITVQRETEDGVEEITASFNVTSSIMSAVA